MFFMLGFVFIERLKPLRCIHILFSPLGFPCIINMRISVISLHFPSSSLISLSFQLLIFDLSRVHLYIL